MTNPHSLHRMKTIWGIFLFTILWGVYCLLVFIVSILTLENPFRNVAKVLRALGGDRY
jgi:hypothetical protein